MKSLGQVIRIRTFSMQIETSLQKALKDCGGIFENEVWVSGNSAVVEIKCAAKVHVVHFKL
jgi:hypothetical protein